MSATVGDQASEDFRHSRHLYRRDAMLVQRVLTPRNIDSTLLDGLRGATRAAMVYGSFARNDHGPDSDIDVLQLTPSPQRPYDVGRVSVTVYTADHLRALARSGSLFVLHLRNEGRVLLDPHGELREVLAEYREPSDYHRMLDSLRAASGILDASREQFALNPTGFMRVALYILRSTLYMRCAEKGEPSFSMKRVAAVLGDARVEPVFAARHEPDPGFERFLGVRRLVEEHLDASAVNAYETLEALAVSCFHRFPMASTLALRVLGGSRDIDYQSIPPDWA